MVYHVKLNIMRLKFIKRFLHVYMLFWKVGRIKNMYKLLWNWGNICYEKWFGYCICKLTQCCLNFWIKDKDQFVGLLSVHVTKFANGLYYIYLILNYRLSFVCTLLKIIVHFKVVWFIILKKIFYLC